MIDTQVSDIVEHAANAWGIGATMPPSTVLIYGSPKDGTPAMLANPQAAPDLPLRVLVRQAADGRVKVALHPVATMLCRAGVPADRAARLDPAQRMFIAAIAS